MKNRNQTGEVIATSYSSFTVESYELNNTPPLGGLVIAENVIGVVCSARTEGLGPISAKGSLGDEDERNAVYTYPECPPRVHYKCWLAGDDELVHFTDRPDYLRLLLFSTEADPANMDQVLIHLILRSFRARNNDQEWLSTTAEFLGRQLKGQYDRLLAILKTLDALTSAPTTHNKMPLSDAVGNVKM